MERTHLATLTRRLAYLEQQLPKYTERGDTTLGHMHREIAALQWVLLELADVAANAEVSPC